MSRYFVLAYKRSAGRLIEPVYESGGIADATSQRYSWEQKYRSAEQDVEVAVLTAPSLADLKKTHSRYFRSLSEMVKG
jgi:hypothetical protein